MQHEIVNIISYWNSTTTNSAIYSVEKWYFFSLEKMIKASKYYYYCFTTTHQSAEHVAK